MANRVGQQLGNYRLVRSLGVGGFAEVYLGEQIYLHTKAAIKVLKKEILENDLETFLTEGRTVANLIHPNIVRVLDFGLDENNTPFLVMMYAPLGTLRHRHPKGTRLSPATILPYVKQIASALQYAHDQGLIHRDVKPENMLLESEDHVLLSDFGIVAIALSTNDMITQKPIGTLPYMAPEQHKGKPRKESDQYALGIVVYEWLCGERPFNGNSLEIIEQHLHEPPPRLSEKIPTITREIEQVVLKSLAKDPKQRFTSVEEFANALERAIKSSVAPPPLNISRRVLISGLTAGLIAAGGGITWWELTHGQTAPHNSSHGTLTAPINRPTPTQTASSVSPTTIKTPLYTYPGHTSNLAGVAWSPDGRYVASIAIDKTVQVWNPFVTNNQSILLFKGYLSGTGDSVTWSPDGKYIATADDNGIISIWDWQASSNNLVFAFGTLHPVRCVSWSPDGKYLAIASIDFVAQVFDASNVTVRHLVNTYGGHKEAVNGVTWSHNSTYFATASKDTTVRVWKASNGDLLGIYRGHTDEVYAVAWSPTGDSIASVGCDATVQIWNAFNQERLFLTQFPGKLNCVHAVSWSPDGKYLVASSWNGNVVIWSPPQSTPSLIYTGHHTKAVAAVAWSPKGNYIASGSDDHTVQVWQF